MEKNITGALKYTIRCLEKEWLRSGETKFTEETDINDIEHIISLICAKAEETRDIFLPENRMDFMETLSISHMNHILLRLGRKYSKALKNARKKENKCAYIKLDKEETKMLCRLRDLERRKMLIGK